MNWFEKRIIFGNDLNLVLGHDDVICVVVQVECDRIMGGFCT